MSGFRLKPGLWRGWDSPGYSAPLSNCGLHDIKTAPGSEDKQVSIADYRDNLLRIVDVAEALRPQLVWIRTTPCDEAVHNRPGMAFHRFRADCDAYNAVADEVMAGSGVPSIDLHGFTKRLGPDLYCDHVHFHDRVRGLQAAYLAGWITAWHGHHG